MKVLNYFRRLYTTLLKGENFNSKDYPEDFFAFLQSEEIQRDFISWRIKNEPIESPERPYLGNCSTSDSAPPLEIWSFYPSGPLSPEDQLAVRNLIGYT